MAQSPGYESNADLPARVRRELPNDAQDVYRLAYNSALASGVNEVQANASAWDAVKLGWRNQNGRWIQLEVVK
jgi:cation transport regulator